MARTGFFHHIGTFLLFAASILLLVTTISSPVVNDIAVLKVTLTNRTNIRNTSVTFGTFGYCLRDVAPIDTVQDLCTGKNIGYDPATVMANIEGTGFSTASGDTANGLTRVMVLHPICCGLAFIAFLLALGSGICGALLAFLVSLVTWALTLVVMATDFVAFGIIKNNVNNDGTGSSASFSTAMWTLLTAMICLFFAMFLVLFTCFSARRHRHDVQHSKAVGEPGYVAPPTTTYRRRFWQRRARY